MLNIDKVSCKALIFCCKKAFFRPHSISIRSVCAFSDISQSCYHDKEVRTAQIHFIGEVYLIIWCSTLFSPVRKHVFAIHSHFILLAFLFCTHSVVFFQFYHFPLSLWLQSVYRGLRKSQNCICKATLLWTHYSHRKPFKLWPLIKMQKSMQTPWLFNWEIGQFLILGALFGLWAEWSFMLQGSCCATPWLILLEQHITAEHITAVNDVGTQNTSILLKDDEDLWCMMTKIALWIRTAKHCVSERRQHDGL